MAVEIYVHKMTEHMATAKVIRWLVKEGDAVVSGQAILEVETEKAVVELEASASGVLKGIRPGVLEGSEVRVGETLAFIAERDESVPALSPLAPTPAQPERQAAPSERRGTPDTSLRATPVARRVARELAVELRLVQGTGRDGCIREEDVRAFAALQGRGVGESSKGTPKLTPEVGPGAMPDTAGAWLELSPTQRTTGRRMLESVRTAPQFVLSTDVDMSRVLAMRGASQQDTRTEDAGGVSITSVVVKATALTLKTHPRLNASYVDGRIWLHEPINVGVAVGGDMGLYVPVVLAADQKALSEIEREIRALREKAQKMHFSEKDLLGGTFTISNLGMHGVDRFAAIINPPQSAILAMGRIRKLPVFNGDDRLVCRPMVTLSLTIDHRVMDGLHGARFLGDLKAILEEPGALLA